MRTVLVATLAVGFVGQMTWGATEVARYEFNNTFAATQSGPPALAVTDPAATSAFVADTVFGSPRQVWAFNGAASPVTSQAGVTLNTTGLLTPDSYSVDMVFEFFDRAGAWRRILDVQNRQSDNGFYVDPGNNLDVFPVNGSTAAWTNSVYHHVVMTDDGTTVSGYLDGVSQFSAPTTELNLDFDTVNNPNQLLGFFLDNVAGGGQGEWSSGRVALIRVWDGVLTPQEAQTLATNPFVGVPEPASLGLLAAGGLALLARRRRS